MYCNLCGNSQEFDVDVAAEPGPLCNEHAYLIVSKYRALHNPWHHNYYQNYTSLYCIDAIIWLSYLG